MWQGTGKNLVVGIFSGESTIEEMIGVGWREGVAWISLCQFLLCGRVEKSTQE